MFDGFTRGVIVRSIRDLLLSLCFLFLMMPSPASADPNSQFAKFAGRWTGEGMLGFKASAPERVKCRATYFLNDAKDELKQTIRCATSGGSIEVLSNIKDAAGKLTGHWKETTHNFEGDLSGDVTPKGFRIKVQGADLAANMDIVVRDNKQVVEIQFINTSLIGLTLMMTKG
jgi:hypothetical protein